MDYPLLVWEEKSVKSGSGRSPVDHVVDLDGLVHVCFDPADQERVVIAIARGNERHLCRSRFSTWSREHGMFKARVTSSSVEPSKHLHSENMMATKAASSWIAQNK